MIDWLSFVQGLFLGFLLGSILVIIFWILDLQHIRDRNRKTFQELQEKYQA